MPNPFTCARGRLGRGTAKSSLQRQPAGRVVSGGTLPVSSGVQRGLAGFYSSRPAARPLLGSSTVGAVGCGSARRRSPSSLVSPLPRLDGTTAHPAPFQGVSRGKQRTPHICDCTGGKKKKSLFCEAFYFEKKKKNSFIQKSVVSGKYLVCSSCNLPPFLSMQLKSSLQTATYITLSVG